MIRHLGAIFIILFFFSCNPRETAMERKMRPSDHLYWQRTFPDQRFDIDGWQKEIARVNKSVRDASKEREAGAWITEGPGNSGARINTIAVHPTDPNIILIGYSAGGIYKTVNGGASWKPVFDDFAMLAIGDIVFDVEDPQVVYAGTGDPNISGIPFVGDGIYKSADQGENWAYLGLDQVGIISKILIDPNDNDVLYVGAMGIPYFRNTDRGLYKSIDGGASWSRILFLGTGTGVIDIVMDKKDSRILYAAGWDRIRNYEESISEGTGSRIHKSIDGGVTWTMMEGGLPNAEHSRIGLAISESNPNRLYAVYVGLNFDLENVFTSEDGGINWIAIPTDRDSGMGTAPFGGFGWYFGKIRLDPQDEHKLYLLGVRLWRWNNVTKRWTRVDQFTGDEVHADKHDMAFVDAETTLLATDGGLYRSSNDARDWFDIEDIPTTQFYRVAYNPHNPILYYGGAQDNGSVAGNAETILEWDNYYGGDGFRTLFHPEDPLIYYVETQSGGLAVTFDGGNTYEGATKGIGRSDNVNWDAPVIMSDFDPDVLYLGTDRLYKSTTGVQEEFKPISGLLTDPVVLLDATSNITTIEESSFEKDILFAGTGDGNVFRTTDGGESWLKVDAGLPDRYVTSISASPTFQDVVFVTHSGFKAGKKTPHIHRSDNLGASWIDISSNLPSLPINDILVLPNNNDQVLFVATDAGVYLSRNAGNSWTRLGNNMPLVPVFDIEYNPVFNTLIAGTHAKSIMSFDLLQEDIRGDETIGIHELNLLQLSVYPNPVRDVLKFETTETISLLRVIDASGQVVLLKKAPQNQIDVSGLRPGIFTLEVFGKARGVTTFIKE